MGLAVGGTVFGGIAIPLVAAELQFWKVGPLLHFQHCLCCFWQRGDPMLAPVAAEL